MDKNKYQLSTLKEMPNLFNETISLIEEAFSYDSKNHFDIDFAPLMAKENHQHCHILLENNIVIGHIGIKLRNFGNKLINTPVALMGGIAIAKGHQGKGIFNMFFTKIESLYIKKVSLFILWSNLDELYKKYDFYQAGALTQTGSKVFCDQELDESFTHVKLADLSAKIIDEIKLIYREEIEDRYTTLKRNQTIWNQLLKINSTKLFIYKVENTIQGYFFVGKGQDLTHIIHEAACREQFKNDFINHLKAYRLWLPEKEVISDTELFYSAIFKIADMKTFNQFLFKWSLGDSKLIKMTKESFSILHKNLEFTILPTEFYTFLFGPSKIVEFDNYGSPLYLSGLDSI